MGQRNVYCFLRGLSRLVRCRRWASRFQLTLCQRISRRHGMIVQAIHRNIFGQYLCKTLGSPRCLFFLRDVGNMVIKIDPCFPSNLSKQLTCKQHDTVARAHVSFVSIAVIFDSLEICIKLIRKYLAARRTSIFVRRNNQRARAMRKVRSESSISRRLLPLHARFMYRSFRPLVGVVRVIDNIISLFFDRYDYPRKLLDRHSSNGNWFPYRTAPYNLAHSPCYVSKRFPAGSPRLS